MKRIIDCTKNDQIRNIRTNKTYVVVNSNPFLVTDTQGITTEVKKATLKRWYKYMKTLSSSEVPYATGCQVPEAAITVEVTPDEVVPEVFETVSSQLTMLSIKEISESLGCTIKENKSHSVVKYNNKNIIEVHPTKKHINLIFRDTILSEDEKEMLARDYKGKIANVTWVLNYKIVATQTDIFDKIIRLAIAKA